MNVYNNDTFKNILFHLRKFVCEQEEMLNKYLDVTTLMDSNTVIKINKAKQVPKILRSIILDKETISLLEEDELIKSLGHNIFISQYKLDEIIEYARTDGSMSGKVFKRADLMAIRKYKKANNSFNYFSFNYLDCLFDSYNEHVGFKFDDYQELYLKKIVKKIETNI